MTVSDELKNKELAKQHANPGPKATPTSIPPALMAWWIPILVGTLLFSLSLTISMFWRDSDKLVQLLHRSAVSCLTVLVLTLIAITVHVLLKQKGIRQQEPLLCKILRTSLSSIFLYASTLIIGTIVACGFYTAVKNGAHWPSKDAMILCTTTSGAGSLFSTWQQRSYENQIRAEQEEQKRLQYHRDTTRDEHWRRREKAYQLLADPSPNMRLIAASLLIELADSTLAAVESANSTFDTALLQQNIIDILCTQIRHEGYNLESEGTKEEHAHVQSTIVNKLLMWLSKREAGAPHSTQASRTINLSRVTFLPPLVIESATVIGEVNFTDSAFHEKVIVAGSEFRNLRWKGATFLSELDIAQTKIIHDGFPLIVANASCTGCDFQPQGKAQTLRFNLGSTRSNIAFESECTFHGRLIVSTTEDYRAAKGSITPDLTFSHCQFESLEISSLCITSILKITRSRIRRQLQTGRIRYVKATNRHFLEGSTAAETAIMIYDNTFFSDGTISPMRISPDHMDEETRAIRTGNKLFSIFEGNKVIIGGIERDLVIKHMPDDIGGMSFFYFIRFPEGEKELIVPEDTTEDARIMREAMDRIRHEPPILF